MLIGCAMTTIKARAFRLWMPLIVLVPALALVSVQNINNRTAARPWPPLFSQNVLDVGPNDEVVAADPEILCVFDYYRHRQAPRTVQQWRLERGPEQVYRSRQRIPLGCNEADPLTTEALSRRLADGNGVWLLAGDDLQRRDVDAVLQALGAAVSITHHYESQGRTYAWRLVSG
jgi:hypothetical protein